MDQELQSLLTMLYGNRQMGEREIAAYTKQWNSNHNGFRDNLKNAALNKIKQDKGSQNYKPTTIDSSTIKAMQAKPTLVSVQRDAENIKPIEPKRAANDMSAIANFKEAFRAARQAGHKTFFWKKTKGNPSGMFSTDMATEGGNSQKANKVFADTDKTDLPIFTGQYQNPLPDVTSARIPVQGPINHEQIDDPNFVPRIPIQGKTDLPIFNKQQPVEVNITGNNTRVAGRRYGEGQKNANLYFGRKGAGMFSGGGNISQPGNPGASIADVITVINSKDKNAIQELFSSIGQEGFEQAIRSIQQMAKEGDGSAMQALQTLQELMQGSQKAKLGAKLNYIQKLKGICPEGEELVYMKEGGRVCPVCQKKAEKAQGGKKLEEKKKNAVSDFKEKRKAVNPNDTVNTKFGPRDLNGKTKYPKYNANKENYDFETRKRVQEKDEKSGKKVIGSACGSKMKKKK